MTAAAETRADPEIVPGAHPLWLPLGELLVERGLLSRRQLELALAEQKRTGRRLGEVLVAYGFVSQQALTTTLLEQVGGVEPEAVEKDVDDPAEAPDTAASPRPQPMIVRLDADGDGNRGRWWSRGASKARVAELERALEDFERRSREIQANIVEIRATLRAIHDAG